MLEQAGVGSIMFLSDPVLERSSVEAIVWRSDPVFERSSDGMIECSSDRVFTRSTRFYSNPAFTIASPTVWNSLPSNLRAITNIYRHFQERSQSSFV